MIAVDRKQARQLTNYVKGLIADSPVIAAEVTNQTFDTVAFAHRVQLEVHTTSFRSTRGRFLAMSWGPILLLMPNSIPR
jgi:hypothetical protein